MMNGDEDTFNNSLYNPKPNDCFDPDQNHEDESKIEDNPYQVESKADQQQDNPF